MTPGSRQDGGETAALDQGRAEARVELTRATQFILIVEGDTPGKVRVVGACETGFEFEALTVLADHALGRYMEGGLHE